MSGPAPVSDMRTVNWRASVSCHFASTPARSLNAPLRIPLATSDLVCASVWLLIFSRVFLRHVAAHGANRRGPRGEPPRPSGFQPTPLLLYKRNRRPFFLFSHSPLPRAQCSSTLCLHRSPSAAACSSPSPGKLTPPFRRTSSCGNPLQRALRVRCIRTSSRTSPPRRRRTSSLAAGLPFLRRTSSSATPPPQVRPDAPLPLSFLDFGSWGR